MSRYLIVMEVESNIELERSDSVSPRWRLFDVYPNITSENYPPQDTDPPGEYDIDITAVHAVTEIA